MDLTRSDISGIAELVAKEVMERVMTAPMGRWMTLDEASAYAKVGKRTLVDWLNKGLIKGKPRSGNGNWIVDRQSIDEWYSRS